MAGVAIGAGDESERVGVKAAAGVVTMMLEEEVVVKTGAKEAGK
jgi:hypothetical protein